MLGALAGLPSLGGIGGSFGGSSLPLFGFALLSTLTSQLTTNAFLGPRTAIPDLSANSTNLGNLTASFSGYTGSTSVSEPFAQFTNTDYRAWHQWATGGGQSPVLVSVNPGQVVHQGTAFYGSASSQPPRPCGHYAPAPCCGQPSGVDPALLGSISGYHQNYQALPQGAAVPLYGFSNQGPYQMGWGFPAQPGQFYQPAQTCYCAPVMQHQSCYGYGGPPRPTPAPAPNYPPRPPAPQPPNPNPTPPAAPPSEPVLLRSRINYPLIPNIDNDAQQASQVLKSRLVGDPGKIAQFGQAIPLPTQNGDAMRFDRIAAYYVMQQDTSLRYNVDSGRFFRSYSDGQTREVLDMASLTQMLRQNHNQHYPRVGEFLKHMPSDEQLFGSRSPANSGARPTFTTSVIPINPGLPSFGGIPNSGGRTPALDQLLTDRQNGQIIPSDFNAGLIKIAAQNGVLNPNPMASSPARGPFTITAHRYWDSAAGGYVNVNEITLTGGGDDPNETTRVYNPNQQTTVAVNKDGVRVGSPVRVTVSWSNGQSRTWDYQIADQNGSDVDVFSPLG